jgi:uncharacterized phiE125 gp8 family phage protein
MNLHLITPPSIEPITLLQAKAHVNITHDGEDEAILSLIRTAREWVESQTRRQLIDQVWRLTLSRWPARVIPLSLSPVKQIEAVRIFNTSGVALPLDTSSFVIERSLEPPFLLLPSNPLEPGQATNGIEIDIKTGFGTTGEAVPALLRHAVLRTVAWLRRNQIETPGPVPADILALLAPWRMTRLVSGRS